MKIKRNSRDAQTEPMDSLVVPKPKRRIWDLSNSTKDPTEQDSRGGSLATPITVRDPVVQLLKPRTAMSLSRLATKEQASAQGKTPNQAFFPFKFEYFDTPKRPFVSPLSPLSPDYSRISLKTLLATLDSDTKTPVSNHSPFPASYESLSRPLPYKAKAIRRVPRPTVPCPGLVQGKNKRKPLEKPKTGLGQLRRKQKSQDSLSSWRVTANTFDMW